MSYSTTADLARDTTGAPDRADNDTVPSHDTPAPGETAGTAAACPNAGTPLVSKPDGVESAGWDRPSFLTPTYLRGIAGPLPTSSPRLP